VLVHGLGLSGRYMLPLAACLADAYRVFLPDLPGFGDSSHPHEVLDVGGLADALAAWLDAMDLPRVALLGNSFGCQIIVDLAARHPDRLDLPKGTRELVLFFENVTPQTKEPFLQWLLYGLPADLDGLPEGFKHKREPAGRPHCDRARTRSATSATTVRSGQSVAGCPAGSAGARPTGNSISRPARTRRWSPRRSPAARSSRRSSA
jgi:pimeloyl-ACP methyl ester carboxylesterase